MELFGVVWTLLILSGVGRVQGQNPDMEEEMGEVEERYIFSFLSNAFYRETHGQIFIAPTTNKPTCGFVWLPYLDFEEYFYDLQFGNFTVINLPFQANPIGTGEQPSTVVVEANADIMVYGIHFRPEQFTQESFVVVPRRALGTEYYVASYSPLQSWSPVFTVTAVENDTEISIAFSRGFGYEGRTYTKQRPLNLILNKYQTYQFETAFDPTGTYISSNKPISVSSGSECSYVPVEVPTCDNLLEHLPPVTSWGRRFSLAPFRGRESAGYVIRVIAAFRNTQVRLSTTNRRKVLQNGRFFEEDVLHQGVLEITSNNPILVLQYQKGNDINDLENGDPSMVIVPSHEQSRRGDIIVPVYDIESAHLTVRLTKGDVRSLLLDGERTEWDFIDKDYSGGKIFQKDVTPGYHVINHVYANAEISVLVYGNERQKTYAHPGSYKFERIPPVGATCTIWGDPHYITFDGRKYDFQGACEYVLTETCGYIADLYPFQIIGDNFKFRPSHKFSLLGSLRLLVFGKEYELNPKDEVRVDGVTTTLPYSDKFGVTIYYSRPHRILMTEFGLTIRIDDKYNAEIGISSTYMGKVCGLCGNYDGDPENEYVSPNGDQIYSVDNFATSWVINDRETCEAYIPQEPCDDGGGSPNIQRARNLCGVLRNRKGPFSACRDVVDPQPYFETCVYDLCAMFPDVSMLCSHLEQYAQACRNAGERPGNWRAYRSQCAFECPGDMVYNPCGTGCPATCVEQEAREDCPMTCLETCECPEGTVLDGTNCVEPSQCGCPLPDGGYASEGEEVMFEDCTLTCFCLNGTLECTEIECDINAQCDVRDGKRDCYCNDGYVGNGTLCEPAPKFCQIFGDPHYNTYDNVMYRFAGQCSYMLTQTCGRLRGLPTFRIVGSNEVTMAGIFSTNIRSIRLSAFGKSFLLDNTGTAYVGGVFVDSFPYFDDDGVVITYSYPSLMIMTDFGVNIKYNFLGNGSASIEVPPWYFGKLCGLCGNADGDPDNEYKLPNGDIVSSPVAFANEWNVGYCPSTAPVNPQPCLENPEAFVSAKDNCYFLVSERGPLSQCYDFVDPTPYYEACLFDLCTVYPYREFMCDSAMHYVEACAHAGGRPRNWRELVPDCDMRCPINSTYGSCNSGCPKTCSNPDGLNNCPMNCLETCECPPGYVLDNDRCVHLSQCRCPDPNGGMVLPGTVHIDEECTFKCKCIDGVYSCFNITCDENAVCEQRGSFRDCYCNDGYQGDGLECYTQVEERCDPPWYTPRQGSCYGFYDTPKSFQEADAFCQRNYGNLVSISDAKENAFVTRLANGERAWIGGLRNVSLESAWKRTDASYSFNYVRKQMPPEIHRIEFSVRARKNAHIALSPYDSDNPDMYEIVIGGWNNEKSAIRRCKGCDSEVEVDTPGILNPRLDVRFYITFKVGVIEVGLLGDDPFMSWTDPDPIDCHYVGYTTALNSGRWKFYNQFVWLNGDPWVYENWRRGEPSNHNGNEGCIEINYITEGLWNDIQCSIRKPFVCEKPKMSNISPTYLP
ncbi:IgGFc-binding protein [Holothuria leucospilota]|uniref:IgGFc-binding protein n=1 Tax=Holothuria leucospilota TaxID=206669 RepID=A0A9Q1HE69_HOLLE|nr:IgGFc-binding protein [Holothuria leucospilota]